MIYKENIILFGRLKFAFEGGKNLFDFSTRFQVKQSSQNKIPYNTASTPAQLPNLEPCGIYLIPLNIIRI